MNVTLANYIKLEGLTPHPQPQRTDDAFAVGGTVFCRYGNSVVEIRHTEHGLEVIAQSSSYAAPAHLIVEDPKMKLVTAKSTRKPQRQAGGTDEATNDLITPEECARLLGMSTSSVWRITKVGRLRVVYVLGRARYSRAEVMRLVRPKQKKHAPTRETRKPRSSTRKRRKQTR